MVLPDFTNTLFRWKNNQITYRRMSNKNTSPVEISTSSEIGTISDLIMKLKSNYQKVQAINESNIEPSLKINAISELTRINIGLGLELKSALIYQLNQQTSNAEPANILVTKQEVKPSNSHFEINDDYAEAIEYFSNN